MSTFIRYVKFSVVPLLLLTSWGCQSNSQRGSSLSTPPRSSFAEGTAIQDSSNNKVYFIAGAQRHYIKFPATLQALGVDKLLKVEPDSVVSSIPLGNDMPVITSRAVQDSSTGKVYVLQAGKRRYVPDTATLQKLNLDKVQGLSGLDASSIPLGPPLPQIERR